MTRRILWLARRKGLGCGRFWGVGGKGGREEKNESGREEAGWQAGASGVFFLFRIYDRAGALRRGCIWGVGLLLSFFFLPPSLPILSAFLFSLQRKKAKDEKKVIFSSAGFPSVFLLQHKKLLCTVVCPNVQNFDLHSLHWGRLSQVVDGLSKFSKHDDQKFLVCPSHRGGAPLSV